MKRLFALTPEAKSDLKEILLDIAEDSPATAERLRTEFYEGAFRYTLGRAQRDRDYQTQGFAAAV